MTKMQLRLPRSALGLTLSFATCASLVLLEYGTLPSHADKVQASQELIATPALAPRPAAEVFSIDDTRPMFGARQHQGTLQNATQPKPPSTDEPQLRMALEGVIMTPNSRRACLGIMPDGPSRCLKEGGSMDGWTLVEIKPQDVTLRHGAQTRKLKLAGKAR